MWVGWVGQGLHAVRWWGTAVQGYSAQHQQSK